MKKVSPEAYASIIRIRKRIKKLETELLESPEQAEVLEKQIKLLKEMERKRLG
jgi:hypothetical protein